MPSGTFILRSNYTPAGDQPEAIARLISDVEAGATHQTLKGITGSGKTFTMANVIHRLKRPSLILAPNKTSTAQLYGEMRHFFRKTRSSILSPTTTISSPKSIFRAAISSFRRIRQSMSIWNGCASPRRSH